MMDVKRFPTVTDTSSAFAPKDGRIFAGKDGVYYYNGKEAFVKKGEDIVRVIESCGVEECGE